MLSQIAPSVSEPAPIVFVQAVISPTNPITNSIRILLILLLCATNRFLGRVPALLGYNCRK
jgi:hypothetical protein